MSATMSQRKRQPEQVPMQKTQGMSSRNLSNTITPEVEKHCARADLGFLVGLLFASIASGVIWGAKAGALLFFGVMALLMVGNAVVSMILARLAVKKAATTNRGREDGE